METKLKLEINQLKNYLGTDIKVIHPWDDQKKWSLTLRNTNEEITIDTTLGIEGRLECYRLSDLDKFIPELGFVPLEEVLKEVISKNGSCEDGDGYFGWNCSIGGDDYQDYWADIDSNFNINYSSGHSNEGGFQTGSESLNFKYIQKLFEWHFWPFGDEYFEQGLIIDKLTYGR